MSRSLFLLAAMALHTHAAAPAPPPPAAEAPRSLDRLLDDAAAAEAIFTYRVDGRCRIGDTRKLQGPDPVRWRDADEALDITAAQTVFRYVDGRRTQLEERRVKLLGEMVREGVLVCHVRPSGEVVKAWIERRDPEAARRRVVQREEIALRDGRIGDLGTYSVSFQAGRGLETAPTAGTEGRRGRETAPTVGTEGRRGRETAPTVDTTPTVGTR